MKLPDELELVIDDVPVRVRYDYDRGEDQWFDARAGVGSPGYPASACVTELSFDNVAWSPAEQFPNLDFEKLDAQLMDRLAELEAEDSAAIAQAEYDAWEELKQWREVQ